MHAAYSSAATGIDRDDRRAASCRGDSLAASGSGPRAAVAKGAARKCGRAARHHAREYAQRLAGLCHARHRNAVEEAARVGMAWVARRALGGRPVSTTSPAYITATRCAMRATMPRSWVMSNKSEAEFVLQFVQ